jgi:hypothetical protein
MCQPGLVEWTIEAGKYALGEFFILMLLSL